MPRDVEPGVDVQHGGTPGLAGRLGFSPKPGEQRIFLVAGGARHTADTVAFGELGKRFDDFTRRCLLPIKQSPFGYRV